MVEPTNSDSIPSTAAGKSGEDADQLLNEARRQNCGKKAKKIFSQLGLKPIHGVTRVIMRKSQNVLLIINNPEVLKSPWSDTYIVFGDLTVKDLNKQSQVKAAKDIKKTNLMIASGGESTNQPVQKKENKADGGELDYQGVNEQDVDLVLKQVKVTRRQAVDALLKNDNDVIDAIMDLTV